MYQRRTQRKPTIVQESEGLQDIYVLTVRPPHSDQSRTTFRRILVVSGLISEGPPHRPSGPLLRLT